MRKQKDTSTSLSASSSLRSGHGSGLKTKKSPSMVRQFDIAHGKPPLRPILRSAQDRAQSFGSPQTPLGMTPTEGKDSSTMPDKSGKLRVTSMERKAILEKLTTLEILLKKKDDKPLTFKEACAYLGYAPSYLYKLTYRKVIPYYKPTGKMIFFSKNELNEWVYKSRCQNSEISSQNENEEKSKDPNQIEMFRKSPGNSDEAIENDASIALRQSSGRDSAQEIVIEFPLKSRRRKEL